MTTTARVHLPSIYPITNTRLCALSHTEQVAELIKGGAKWVQLREKAFTTREFYYAAQSAMKLAQSHGTKLIVNDRVDIALLTGADGVHLGQDDMPPDAARRVLGEGTIIGYSTHNVQQAIDAVRSYPVDYIAIGPIFGTTTKKNADPIVGLDGITAVRSAIGDFPLVAIGGITSAAVHEVLAAGADSIALISEVLDGGPFDIARRLADLRFVAANC